MTSDTGTLAVRRSGPRPDEAGPPLVLLHGFPFDARMWDAVVAHIPQVPVLALDAPGFGDSPSPQHVARALGRDAAPALELTADAVVATLDAEGVAR